MSETKMERPEVVPPTNTISTEIATPRIKIARKVVIRRPNLPLGDYRHERPDLRHSDAHQRLSDRMDSVQ
jgi:hypothetical protein